MIAFAEPLDAHWTHGRGIVEVHAGIFPKPLVVVPGGTRGRRPATGRDIATWGRDRAQDWVSAAVLPGFESLLDEVRPTDRVPSRCGPEVVRHAGQAVLGLVWGLALD